jgi:chromosome segregation ATPase
MMLFAEESSSTSVEAAVWMAAIALLSSVATLLVGWLKDRDKLKYGAEITVLQGEKKAQDTAIELLTTKVGHYEEKHAQSQESIKTLTTKVDECEEQHAQAKEALSIAKETLSAVATANEERMKKLEDSIKSMQPPDKEQT